VGELPAGVVCAKSWQLIIEEVWNHGSAPSHCGITGALYSIRGLVELSAVERLFGGQDERIGAKRLAQKYATHAAAWQAGKVNLETIKAWVGEADTLAKDVAYSQLLPTPVCEADLEQARLTLSEHYVQQTGPVIEEQLAKAGYRLAAVLNHALGN
jgi:hypothetical protein